MEYKKSYTCRKKHLFKNIVPKVNHTQRNTRIRRFKRKLFKYIWNEKLDTIKRNTLIKGYENAGLKVIDIKNFMMAL